MPLLARVAARSVERLSPSYVRVELAGPDLADFGVDGPTLDQRIKLLFPGPAGLPVLNGDTWWQEFSALPEGERGAMRTYTIREVRGEGAEVGIVVDFVLHGADGDGAHGPGSDWAGGARVGDELLIVVPRRGEFFGGIEWDPGDAERLLLVGDETAVPAICSILGSLPDHAAGTAVLEVPTQDDVQKIDAPTGIDVRWLPREGAPVGALALEAVGGLLGFSADDPSPDEAELGDLDLWETPTYSSSGEVIADEPAPTDGRYAWIAGESRMVTALRRHLVNELALPRRQVAFMGYWRQGVAMRG
ncbi:siderophore-interacting protein [Nocardioides sp. DS6]|uniref:Siderophore-interacting protein n=1 Tax=Nocardioides eburneus TaxID=3231482 RepID=A0ABV3SZ48_9ACTN